MVDAAIKDNADDCLSYCQQDEYCNWFSYDPIGRVCELFESCQSLSVEFCPQCVSGESSCEPRVCSISGICEVCKGVSDLKAHLDYLYHHARSLWIIEFSNPFALNYMLLKKI